MHSRFTSYDVAVSEIYVGYRQLTHVYHYNVNAVCCSSLVHEENICDSHLANRLGQTTSDACKDIGAPNLASCAHFRLPDSGCQTSGRAEEVATRRKYECRLGSRRYDATYMTRRPYFNA